MSPAPGRTDRTGVVGLRSCRAPFGDVAEQQRVPHAGDIALGLDELGELRGRAGVAITGALFIKEFIGELPWVHMDIAGPPWAEDAKPYQPKGATGVAVRTLAELALDAGAWAKI